MTLVSSTNHWFNVPSSNPTQLSDGQWDILRHNVRVEANKIILPGFNLGIKNVDEPWEYTPREAWEKFWDRLVFKGQIDAVMQYWKMLSDQTRNTWWFIDDETLFHNLLWMMSHSNSPYYIHGDESNTWRRIRSRSNIWYSLVTSSPFGPWFIPLNNSPKSPLLSCSKLLRPSLKSSEQKTQKFKIRLQAD